ncbi:MAG: ABC transporter ATP-binding protein [Vicinamibacteria bacterium]|nr:ABC transporter ATP-binding protein [Vicinamibacteria bacterium]
MLALRSCEAGYGVLRVVKGVSLHVSPGEIVTIIGANGAGKSTLLKSVAGLIRPDGGEVVFDGRPVRGLPAHRIVERGLVLVPEGRQLFAPMTVEENLVLGGYTRYRRGEASVARRQLERVLDLFPVLAERRRQLAGTLSGGEQQMVAVARALMAAPRMIMLDEPSLGLAPLVVRTILGVLAALRKDGVTILLVEQNAQAALGIADRGYVMETGNILLGGSAAELLDNKDVRRAYLGKDYVRIDE